jgi:DivIVA domain-containing protein
MTLTAADVRSTDFPASSRLRRGYDADAVDAFLERIAVRLETGEGLSSNDVYHVPFAKAGLGGRGYSSAEVDAFLERVHVELARLEDGWGHENVPPQAARTTLDEPDVADGDGAAGAGSGQAALPADGEALAEVATAHTDADLSGGPTSDDRSPGSAEPTDDPADPR